MARLTRIRTQVALSLRDRVDGWWEGVHAGIHAGRSLEFHDLREYQRGDDISDVDWKASARQGSLLVRRHVAEQRTTLVVAIATGRSMAGAATPEVPKSELVLDAAATLAAMALQFGDYVGLAFQAQTAPHVTRPSTRAVQTERMLTLVADHCRVSSPDADLGRVLDLVARTSRRRGLVAVICGDIDVDADLVNRLRRLVVQHEVLMITVGDLDPTDEQCRKRPILGLDDSRLLPADLRHDPGVRAELHRERSQRAARRRQALAQLNIAHTHLTSPEHVVGRVLRLMRSRRHAF